MDFNSMIANVRRAMSLDRTFYQEVAYDERYNQEALMVVIVAAVVNRHRRLFWAASSVSTLSARSLG